MTQSVSIRLDDEVLNCLAHARRKFEEAKSSQPVRAAEALAFIQSLYDIEDRAPRLLARQRRTLRQTEAAPLIARLRPWLDQQLQIALPKLKFGEAVRYLHNQWQPLINYLDDGRVPIDNSDVERDLRASRSDAAIGCLSAVRMRARGRRCCTRWWPAPRGTTWTCGLTSATFLSAWRS